MKTEDEKDARCKQSLTKKWAFLGHTNNIYKTKKEIIWDKICYLSKSPFISMTSFNSNTKSREKGLRDNF